MEVCISLAHYTFAVACGQFWAFAYSNRLGVLCVTCGPVLIEVVYRRHDDPRNLEEWFQERESV